MTDKQRVKRNQELAMDGEKRKGYLRQSDNPIVYRCLRLHRNGDLSYTDALELAVCYLAEENKELFDKLVELTTRLPPSWPAK